MNYHLLFRTWLLLTWFDALEDQVNGRPCPLSSGKLMKTFSMLNQVNSLLEWRPIAYVVIPSTETVPHRLEKERWSLTTTASCCSQHQATDMWWGGVCNGVLGSVQGGGNSRGAVKDCKTCEHLRAPTHLKRLLRDGLSMRNLDKYKTSLESTWREESERDNVMKYWTYDSLNPMT